jgi:hypothetical protein
MSTSTSRPSGFVRALRAASPALWPVRLRLAALKAAYKAGAYSGHPEDTLDGISSLEWMIWQRTNGIRPAAAAPAEHPEPEASSDPAAVNGRTAAEQRTHQELTARCHVDGGPFEPGLDAAERRLAHMQRLYRSGGYMGHPEDMLEDIDAEERRVARLTKEAASA